MLKRLRTAHPIVFCVLAEVVFLASLFVTDLIFTIVLVLLRADFSALDTYLYSTLQELVGALIAVLFLVRTDRAGLLRRRYPGGLYRWVSGGRHCGGGAAGRRLHYPD